MYAGVISFADMPDSQITILLTLLDQAFDHKSWHGTNLKGSIRGLSAADAAWRPSPERHNIWEIVVHAAYWKYAVRRRLLSEAKGSFPLKGSNWIERPSGNPNVSDWKSDLALLNETHKGLREAVAELSSRDLEFKPAGSKVSNLEIITGIASHDLYHAGQIQLLKRERKSEKRGNR
jgi:hypothetical protein